MLKIGIAFLLLFVPLYPKLPSIHIHRTWVYIRLEDFFIAALVLIWIIQLIRGKVKIPWPEGLPIFLYWIIAFVSLIFSLVFLSSVIPHFFPHVAALSFLRRIEYMILFFVAFSTVRNKNDIRDYFIVLLVSLTGILIYGFGQRLYISLWQMFPDFFAKFSFCFPSFQTGNEEFAKGIPLCLPENARLTSTFAGHYDLAAYLVMVIPLLVAVSFAIKRFLYKIPVLFITLGSIILLILTASRVSFGAYLVSIVVTLLFIRKKFFILPIVVLSILLLLVFSGSTAKRFLETIRFTSIVTNSEGEVVGEAASDLPENLKKKISDTSIIDGPPPMQDLPKGSLITTLPSVREKKATTSAVVTNTISPSEIKRLQLQSGALQLSTVSGSFLIQKAFVYDISFTTRFQAEWPNAWNAFLRNPPLGSGFSSITLATDNDYIRALGETGFFGLLSFLFIFLVFGITAKKVALYTPSAFVRFFILGLSGGVVGLLLNAVLIDVFEASKVAENLWMLLGIAVGGALLYKKQPINYLTSIRKVLTSQIFIALYLFILTLIAFAGFINNFFVADDFTWLRWAATASLSEFPGYFTNAEGFFYRPLDKIIAYFLFTFFSFQPAGYHFFILILHFLAGLAVFLYTQKITRRRILAFVAAALFILLPVHAENIFWFSTISVVLSSVLILYALLAMYTYRENGSKFAYFLSIFLFVCALFSYEMAVVFPLLVLAQGIILFRVKWKKDILISYLPLLTLVPLYLILRSSSQAAGFSGDYSYNLAKILPNVIGNLSGYLGFSLIGEPFSPIYTALRDSLKAYATALTVGLFLVLGGVFVALWRVKGQIVQLYEKEQVKIILFGFVFFYIALLPFLGLGNITQRYTYLASAGFILGMVVLAEFILSRLLQNRKKVVLPVLLLLVLVLSLVYYVQLQEAGEKWKKAGEITKETLTFLRVEHEDLPKYSNLYFVNIPIKKSETWIFPVGLEDALWFIYRDPTLQIYKLKTLDEAREMKKRSEEETMVKNYIFNFDEKGMISEVKE